MASELFARLFFIFKLNFSICSRKVHIFYRGGYVMKINFKKRSGSTTTSGEKPQNKLTECLLNNNKKAEENARELSSQSFDTSDQVYQNAREELSSQSFLESSHQARQEESVVKQEAFTRQKPQIPTAVWPRLDSRSKSESSSYMESTTGTAESPYHVRKHRDFHFDDSYWDELEKLLEGMSVDLDEDLLAKISSDSVDLDSSSTETLNSSGYVFGDAVDIIKESSSTEG